ncbi:hypothetical protein FQZ97_1040420 [compost metagenome]
MGAGRDRARVAHHVGEQFAEQGVVVLVHLVVGLPDRQGAFDFRGGVGVQHVAQAVRHQPSHALDRAGERLHRLGLGQDQRPLGDVLGQVAGPLQVRGQLHGPQRPAQVAGDRLAQGDQADRLLLDIAVQGVQAVVALDHRLCQGHVAPGDGFDGVRHLRLGQTAHADDLGRQLVQLVAVSLDRMLVHGRVLSRSGR